MFEDPPDLLNGDCPADWPAKHWLAATLMAEGKTVRFAAGRCKVSAGTVSRWKKAWKLRYGPQFLEGDRARNLPYARQVAAAFREGMNWQDWAPVRASAAAANGVTADLSRQVAQKVLISYLEDPARIAELTPTDALTLAKIADMLERRAEEMTGFGGRTAGGGFSGAGPGAGGEEVPDGILAGLDAPVGEEAESVIAMAAESAATFLHLVADSEIPPDGVIDVKESKTA